MTVITRFVSGSLEALGERDFRGIAATNKFCKDGYALLISGGDLSRLEKGPLSWNHDEPIGQILSTSKTTSQVLITARLAPGGADPFIDEICGRLKAGVPYALSMSFDVQAAEPIVPGNPSKGMRATKWEALEVALCLVGVDPGAAVTARAHRGGAALDLKPLLQRCEQALAEHQALGRHHTDMADALDRTDEHRRAAGSMLRACRRALESGDQDRAQEHFARCQRHVEGLGRELRGLGDRHDDATEAHADLVRAVRSMNECVAGDSHQGAGLDLDVGTPVVDGDAKRARRMLELRTLEQSPESTRERRQRELRMLEIAVLENE